MKQLTVAAVNGGMVRYRSTKAAQQNIARLCRGQGHPVKAGDRHIVQVKVLTVTPPAEAEKAYYASIGNNDLAA